MDRIYRTFLENTLEEARQLQSRSDILTLTPRPPLPPSAYGCEFRTPYLAREPDGTISRREGPVYCAVHFPEDYLRSADSKLYMKVAMVLNPDFVHPNCTRGVVCLGSGFGPGTPLSALIWELGEIVTYRNCTLTEANALNAEACRLLRANPGVLDQLERPRLFRAARKLKIELKARVSHADC